MASSVPRLSVKSSSTTVDSRQRISENEQECDDAYHECRRHLCDVAKNSRIQKTLIDEAGDISTKLDDAVPPEKCWGTEDSGATIAGDVDADTAHSFLHFIARKYN